VSSDLGIRCALLQLDTAETEYFLVCILCLRVCVLWTAIDFDLQYHTVVVLTYFNVPTYLETLGHLNDSINL
jgi:hypothetical protein